MSDKKESKELPSDEKDVEPVPPVDTSSSSKTSPKTSSKAPSKESSLMGNDLVKAVSQAGFDIPVETSDLKTIIIVDPVSGTHMKLSEEQQSYIQSVSRAATLAKAKADLVKQAEADAAAKATATVKEESDALTLKQQKREDRMKSFISATPAAAPVLERTSKAGGPDTSTDPAAPDDFSVVNAGPIDFYGLDDAVWEAVAKNCKFCKGRYLSDLTTLAPRDIIAFPDSKLISSYFVASDTSEVFSTEFDYTKDTSESLKMTSWEIHGAVTTPWGGANFSHKESTEDSLFTSGSTVRAITKYQLPVGYVDFSHEICRCKVPCVKDPTKEDATKSCCTDKIVFAKEFIDDVNEGIMKPGINPRYLSYNKDVKPLVEKFGDCFPMQVSIGMGTVVEHDSVTTAGSTAHDEKKSTAAEVSASAFGCQASLGGGIASDGSTTDTHVKNSDKWAWETISGSVLGNGKNPRSLAENRCDLKSYRVTHIHKLTSFIDVIPDNTDLKTRLNSIVLRDMIPFQIEPVNFINLPCSELAQTMQTARKMRFRLPDNPRLLGYKQEIYTATYNAYFGILLPMFRYPESPGCKPDDPCGPKAYNVATIEDYNYNIIHNNLLPANTPKDLRNVAASLVFDMFRIEDLEIACTLFCGHITQAFNTVETRYQCLNALYLLFCASCMVTARIEDITAWKNDTTGSTWPKYMPWTTGTASPKQTREPLAGIANGILNAVQEALTADGNILSKKENEETDQWLYINYMFAILRALGTTAVTTDVADAPVTITFSPLTGIVVLQQGVVPAITPNKPFTFTVSRDLWTTQDEFEAKLTFLPLFSFKDNGDTSENFRFLNHTDTPAMNAPITVVPFKEPEPVQEVEQTPAFKAQVAAQVAAQLAAALEAEHARAAAELARANGGSSAAAPPPAPPAVTATPSATAEAHSGLFSGGLFTGGKKTGK